MSDELNWIILPNDQNTVTLDSTATAEYHFFNEYSYQCLAYKKTEYGINLGWAELEPGVAAPAFHVLRRNDDGAPVQYGDLVAIAVEPGGYLTYGEQEYGIDLKWSGSPKFEWRIRGDSPPLGSTVKLGQLVALHNTRIPGGADYLICDPRRYGIQLKWGRDKGRFNSRPWYGSLASGLGGFLSQVGSFVFEALNRVVGIVDFVMMLVGIMLPKRLQVQIVILRDEEGTALLLDEDSPAKVLADEQSWIDDAVAVIRECCWNEIKIYVHTASGEFTADASEYHVTIPFPCPTSPLDVDFGPKLFVDDYTESGEFFRRHSARHPPAFGYGSPVTVFVVRDVAEKIGASLGILTDWVVVEAGRGFARYSGALQGVERRPTTPMHEIGHAGGVIKHDSVVDAAPQESKRSHLIESGVPRGTVVSRWQRAVVRGSRHVTFFG